LPILGAKWDEHPAVDFALCECAVFVDRSNAVSSKVFIKNSNISEHSNDA